MPNLELKIPPPALMAVTGALMWLTAKGTPTWCFDFPCRSPVTMAVAMGAGLVALLGVASIRLAHTTSNPRKPEDTSVLVVSGVYRFTRNPMYLGLLLALTAWALYLGKGAPLLFLPAFVIYLTRCQIVPEERILATTFGGQFAAYRARVRRWC